MSGLRCLFLYILGFEDIFYSYLVQEFPNEKKDVLRQITTDAVDEKEPFRMALNNLCGKYPDQIMETMGFLLKSGEEMIVII
jgi:hypothetical protein